MVRTFLEGGKTLGPRQLDSMSPARARLIFNLPRTPNGKSGHAGNDSQYFGRELDEVVCITRRCGTACENQPRTLPNNQVGATITKDAWILLAFPS